MWVLLVWLWAASHSALWLLEGRGSTATAAGPVVALGITIVHRGAAAYMALVDGGGRAVQAVLAVNLPVFEFFVLWFAVLIFPGDVAGHPV